VLRLTQIMIDLSDGVRVLFHFSVVKIFDAFMKSKKLTDKRGV
jgi:hypothetical protein